MEYKSSTFKIKNFCTFFFAIMLCSILFFVISCDSNSDTTKVNPNSPNQPPQPPPQQQVSVLAIYSSDSINVNIGDTKTVDVTFKTVSANNSALVVNLTNLNSDWTYSNGISSCLIASGTDSCVITLNLNTSKGTSGTLSAPFSVTNGKPLNSPIVIPYAVNKKVDPSLPTVSGSAKPTSFTIAKSGTQDVVYTFTSDKPSPAVGPLTISTSTLPPDWTVKSTNNCDSFSSSNPCIVTLTLTNPQTVGSGQKFIIPYNLSNGNKGNVDTISYDVTDVPPPATDPDIELKLDSNNIQAIVGQTSKVRATFTQKNPNFKDAISYFNFSVSTSDGSAAKDWSVDQRNNTCLSFDFKTNNSCTVNFIYSPKKETTQSDTANISYSYKGSPTIPPAQITYSAASNLKWKLDLKTTISSNLAYDSSNKMIYAGSKPDDQGGVFFGISDKNTSGYVDCSSIISDAIDIKSPIFLAPTNLIYIGVQNTDQSASLYTYNEACTLTKTNSLIGNTSTDVSILPYGSSDISNTNPGFYGSNTGIFYTLNGKWSFDTTTKKPIFSTPIYNNSNNKNWFYFGSDDSNVYALSFSNNTLKKEWSYCTGAKTGASCTDINPNYEVRSSPTIDANGMLYIGNEAGNLYAFDTKETTTGQPTRQPKWTFNCTENQPCNIRTKPAVGDDGSIYIGSSGTNGKSIYAVNPDGTLKWKFTTGNQILANPVIGPQNILFAASTDGKLYALDQATGTELWEFQTDNSKPIYSTPVINSDQDTVYLADTAGMFYAVTIPKRNTQSDVTASAVNRNGTPNNSSNPIFASMTYGDTVTITFNKSSSVTSSMKNFTASLLSNDQNSWSFVGENGNSCDTVESTGSECTMTLKFQPTQMNTTKGTGDIGKIGQLFLNLGYTFNSSTTKYTSQIKTAYYQFDDPVKWKTQVPTGGNPMASKLNLGPLIAPDGQTLYITKYGSFTTTQLKTSDGTATGIAYTQYDYYTQLMPTLSKDGKNIYLASYASRGAVSRFGTAPLSHQYNIPIFYNMSLSPDEQTLYVPLNKVLGLLNTSDFSSRSFPLTSQINTDVIVGSDGTVYFGANYLLADGGRFNYLYAIDPANLKDPKWLFQTQDDTLIGTPVLANDDKVIYILTGLGKLYSIDPVNGKQTWISAKIISNGTGDLSNGPTRSQYPAIGQDGTIYIGDNSGVFYAIKPSDGSVNRSVSLAPNPADQTPQQLISVPAIDKDESGKDSLIYVSSYNNNLYALTASGLSKKWTYPIGGVIYQPIIDGKNGLLYAMSSDGYLYALKIRP